MFRLCASSVDFGCSGAHWPLAHSVVASEELHQLLVVSNNSQPVGSSRQKRLSLQNAALDRSVVWLASSWSLGPRWDQLQNKFLVARVGCHLGEGSRSVWSSLVCALGGSVPWPNAEGKPSLEPFSPRLYNWLNRFSFVLGHLYLDRPKSCLWSGSTSVLCAAWSGTSITAPLVAWKLPSALIAWGARTFTARSHSITCPGGVTGGSSVQGSKQDWLLKLYGDAELGRGKGKAAYKNFYS